MAFLPNRSSCAHCAPLKIRLHDLAARCARALRGTLFAGNPAGATSGKANPMTTKIVNLVSHPLVQHKLSLMREKACSTKSFRELLNEIGMLLCYEVTRDLPLELIDIDTPVAAM